MGGRAKQTDRERNAKRNHFPISFLPVEKGRIIHIRSSQMSITIGNIRGNNNKVGRVHSTVIGRDFSGIIVNGQAIGPGADQLKKVAQIQLAFLDEKGQPIGENDS